MMKKLAKNLPDLRIGEDCFCLYRTSMVAVRAKNSSSFPSRTGGYRGTGIAPMYWAPKNASIKSMDVGSMMATRSPFRIPILCSFVPARSTRSNTCAKE